MGNLKTSSNSTLEKADNTVEKFIDIPYLKIDCANFADIINTLNVLIKDYKERYSVE